MAKELTEALDSLECAATRDALQGAVVGLRDRLGVDHVVYHSVNSTGRQYAIHTYSSEWQHRYIENDYARIDPVVLGAYQRFHPVDWKRLDWSTPSARAFRAEALANGVGNQGFTVPIRGPSGQFALFTVSSTMTDQAWSKWCEAHVGDLIVIAHFVNRKALEVEGDRANPASQALSPREIDALTLIAMGYSRAQAAESLSISEHTIRVYIEGARHKLGAQNTVHAVARAMAIGILVI